MRYVLNFYVVPENLSCFMRILFNEAQEKSELLKNVSLILFAQKET